MVLLGVVSLSIFASSCGTYGARRRTRGCVQLSLGLLVIAAIGSILAFVSIIMGTTHYKPLEEKKPTELATTACVAYLGSQVLFGMLLWIHSCCSDPNDNLPEKQPLRQQQWDHGPRTKHPDHSAFKTTNTYNSAALSDEHERSKARENLYGRYPHLLESKQRADERALRDLERDADGKGKCVLQ